MTDYSQYQHLLVEKSDGVALLTMNRPEVLNATNFQLHNELSRIWLDLGADPEVRAAVITGAGNAFSAGGDFEMIEKALGDPQVIASNTQEASDIVYNLLNLDKPVVSSMAWPWAPAWPWPCWPTFPSLRRTPASLMATFGWAWPQEIMRPSSGPCCAAWPRPNTT